jgi:hypothetical protein
MLFRRTPAIRRQLWSDVAIGLVQRSVIMDETRLYRYLARAETTCIAVSLVLILVTVGLIIFGAPPGLANGVVFLLVATACLLLVVRWGLKP